MSPVYSARLVGRLMGLAAIAALLTYSFLQPAPLPFKGFSASLVVLALLNPAWGLLVFAGVAPLSTSIANMLGGFNLSGQVLEQAALAIGAGVMLRAFRQEERTWIGGPAALAVAVALASAGTLIAAGVIVPVGAAAAPPGRLLAQLMDRRLAQGAELWAPFFAAAVVVASALIGWAAERTGRQRPELVSRIVAVSLAGHAAAALLNIETIARLAILKGNIVETLPRLLISERISQQTDVHAAASAFLLAGLAGAGLIRGRGARTAGLVVLLMLVAAGLWITGSRAAIAAGVIVIIGWATWALSRKGRWRLVAPGIAVVAIAASIFVLTHPSKRFNPMSFSVGSRAVLIEAGLQMIKTAPVFGIGVTRFYGTSEALAGPELERLSFYKRENAHNNFLQVAAEQGLVGLVAMLWWLGVVLWSGWRTQVANPNPLRRALLLAIVACTGTWLTGHPLLVPEFSLVFWLYSGMLLATTRAPATRTHWVVPAAIVVVLASVPVRAWTLSNAAELEHIGSGLSLWHHDDEQRYREAGASFAIYLPATDGPVVIPMRRVPGAPDPLVIDVRIRGRIVNSITLRGDAWQTPLVHVSHRWRRFELAEFAVRQLPTNIQSPGVLLRAGKAYQPATAK